MIQIFYYLGDDGCVKNFSPELLARSAGHIITSRFSGRYAVESAGDSDEERTEIATNDGTLFPYNKVKSSGGSIEIYAYI